MFNKIVTAIKKKNEKRVVTQMQPKELCVIFN